MNEQTNIARARAMLAAATPGPRYASSFDRCATSINGLVCAVAPDVVYRDGLRVYRGDDTLALIAASPTMLATLCDALESEARRADEADADAAAMREALVEIGREWTIDEDGCAFCGDGRDGNHDGCPGMIASKATAEGAGRALLYRPHAAEARVRVLINDVDALNRTCIEAQEREAFEASRADGAEAERDAYKRERDEMMLTMVPPFAVAEARANNAENERDALRAESERLKARVAEVCGHCAGSGVTYDPDELEVPEGPVPPEMVCPACHGRGAVIVEGDK